MPSNHLLEAALEYAGLGYSVFPCAPGEKKPITKHGFKDATTDAAKIEDWWTKYPNANIGIPTAGLVVVDLDEGNAWLAGDPDKIIELNVAPLSLTANGGRHFIFRQPAGKAWRNTEGRLASHVDTRTDGGYIVAPPSVLTGDKCYRWAEGQGLAVPPGSLPEPPAWLVDQLDCLATGNSSAAGDAPLALDAHAAVIANKIPAGQRNATLARLAGGMRRVGMSQEEILPALLQVNEDRCEPPINRGEVERIASSVARYAPDEVAVALAEGHWDQMYQDPPDAPNEHGDPGPIPESLLTVPGFIANVTNHTLETAPYPDRALAFGAAITLQGLLTGRKVRDAADNRTNLNIVTLANSGSGKEHPRKVNQRILSSVGLSNSIGDTFASGEGIEDRLFLNPAMLFQTDEIDGLMTKINQARDGRHEGIANVLLKMYSSGNGVYPMRVKAGQEPRVIDQPCLCLYGTAIPALFYKALSVKMLTNGFLARTIVLETQCRSRGQDATVPDLPDPVLQVARYWADFQPGSQGNLNHFHPVPIVIAQTPEAVAVLSRHRDDADQHYTEAHARDDAMGMAIWARANEKARKLALIYACSTNHEQPIIDEDGAQWACNFVDHQTRRMLFMAAGHVAENEFDARCKAVVATLTSWQERHGDAGMPFWRLTRKHPWTEREHEEVRTTLLNQHLIKYEIEKTGGTPRRLYRLA